MSFVVDTALFIGACGFFSWVVGRLFLDRDDRIEEDDWQEVEIELQPDQRQAKLISKNIIE
jgi:hypothetical protein